MEKKSLLDRRVLILGIGILAVVAAVLILQGCKSPDAQTGANTAASTSGTNTASGDEIVIGHFASLTGTTATFGKSTDNGIRLAFEQINAGGGVLGKNISVVTEDNASRTEQVPSVVQKLINQKKVLVLMGEVASSRSLAAAPIAQAAKVPMVSPSSTNPKVTQQGDYIFRTCFIDPFQGTVMSKFARDTLKAKNAAILTDVANDYSKGLTEFFTADWTKNGGKVVATASYTEGAKDFNSQLTKIKAANPDVIYVPGYYTEVGNIAVQARRLGIKQTMLGGDGWDSPKLFEIGGAAVQGSYFSNHYSAQSKDPRVVKFIADYQAKYGSIPDALAAVGYDAALVVADAIKRAGETDRAKIREALATTKDFPGVTGTISIDENRNAVKPAVVLKVEGNEGKYVSTVNP